MACSTSRISTRLILWVSTLRSYSPGSTFNAFAHSAGLRIPSALRINAHRLQYGLQGSLIPFAPHTFVVQCQSYGPSRFSVPEIHLRNWCSHIDPPISLVPIQFPFPLPYSSYLVTCVLPLFWRCSTSSPYNHLPTFYAQSLWTTLASVVWPHLLAQSLDETFPPIPVILLLGFRLLQHLLFFCPWYCKFRLLAHWLLFSTAAFKRSLALFQR